MLSWTTCSGVFAYASDGGVEQWLVEHDKPTDAWQSAERSYRGLSDLRF